MTWKRPLIFCLVLIQLQYSWAAAPLCSGRYAYDSQVAEKTMSDLSDDPKAQKWLISELIKLAQENPDLFENTKKSISDIKIHKRWNFNKPYMRAQLDRAVFDIMKELQGRPDNLTRWYERNGFQIHIYSEAERKHNYQIWLLRTYILKNGIKSILEKKYGETNLGWFNKVRLSLRQIITSRGSQWTFNIVSTAMAPPPYLPWVLGVRPINRIKLDPVLAEKILLDGWEKHQAEIDAKYSADKKFLFYESFRNPVNVIINIIIFAYFLQNMNEILQEYGIDPQLLGLEEDLRALSESSDAK